jgi:hypothetical protein
MNAAQYEEMLSLLKDISSRLDHIESRMNAAPVAVAAHAAVSAPGGGQGPVEGAIADDRDLDSQYGNPEIKKDPPRWTGQSYAGCRFSDASPEYLETLAGFLDWKARKDDESNAVDAKGNPKSKWARLDAARARGWRKRALESKTSNRSVPKPKPVVEAEDVADMPF